MTTGDPVCLFHGMARCNCEPAPWRVRGGEKFFDLSWGCTPRTDALLGQLHAQPLAAKLEQDWTSAVVSLARQLEAELYWLNLVIKMSGTRLDAIPDTTGNELAFRCRHCDSGAVVGEAIPHEDGCPKAAPSESKLLGALKAAEEYIAHRVKGTGGFGETVVLPRLRDAIALSPGQGGR
jgi:hypothetical protein